MDDSAGPRYLFCLERTLLQAIEREVTVQQQRVLQARHDADDSAELEAQQRRLSVVRTSLSRRYRVASSQSSRYFSRRSEAYSLQSWSWRSSFDLTPSSQMSSPGSSQKAVEDSWRESTSRPISRSTAGERLHKQSTEELELERISEDGDDNDDDDNDDTDMGAITLSMLTQEVLEAHSDPLLSIETVNTALKDAASEVGGASEAEELRRELAALKAQLHEAHEQVSRLKAANCGDMSVDEDRMLYDRYTSELRTVLKMRRERRFEQSLFDAYNEALVQLSDEHLRTLYESFMLVYLGESSGSFLTEVGIEVVDETIRGFAEMMSIKLGELLDTSRQQRVHAFRADAHRKIEKEKERQAKLVCKTLWTDT